MKAYRNLAEREAGQRAIADSEAQQMAELRAESILEQKAQRLADDDEFIDQIANAKAEGIAQGSMAGKMDAKREMFNNGQIPGRVMAQEEMKYNAMNAEQELMRQQQKRGLNMTEQSSNGAMEAQVEDISTRLFEAAAQGAPDSEINATLEQLPLPPAIKAEAAKRFIQKRQDISSQEPGGARPMRPTLPGDAVERMNSPITAQAKNILSQTDERMIKLDQLLNPPQQQAPQQ